MQPLTHMFMENQTSKQEVEFDIRKIMQEREIAA